MSKTSKRPTRANRVRMRTERSFGGKLKDFESKEEAIQEAKHLKAYIKGKPFYVHGKREVIDFLGNVSEEPIFHKVIQTITKHKR